MIGQQLRRRVFFDIHTSHAPLTKRSWSVTYIGSVSQRRLVLLTLIPRRSISLHARSISATRSPILLPNAIYAVLLRGPLLPQPPPLAHAQPQALRLSLGTVFRAGERGRTAAMRDGLRGRVGVSEYRDTVAKAREKLGETLWGLLLRLRASVGDGRKDCLMMMFRCCYISTLSLVLSEFGNIGVKLRKFALSARRVCI